MVPSAAVVFDPESSSCFEWIPFSISLLWFINTLLFLLKTWFYDWFVLLWSIFFAGGRCCFFLFAVYNILPKNITNIPHTHTHIWVRKLTFHTYSLLTRVGPNPQMQRVDNGKRDWKMPFEPLFWIPFAVHRQDIVQFMVSLYHPRSNHQLFLVGGWATPLKNMS